MNLSRSTWAAMSIAAIFTIAFAAASYYYYAVPRSTYLRVLYTHSPQMMNEIADDFAVWYGENYGSAIEVTTTVVTPHTAHQKAITTYKDPEAEIWWGGPLSLFENAHGGLLSYNSTYKSQVLEREATYQDRMNFCPLMDRNHSMPSWYAASLSGLGVMYNEHTLNGLGLPTPLNWTDLLGDEYEGKLTMVAPSNPGCTSPFIDLMLQSKSWVEGWEYLVRLAALIEGYDGAETDSALKVASGYKPLTILPDFYAYDKMTDYSNVSFSYMDATLLQPDPVAIYKKGTYLGEARAFIDYTLTEQAQNIIGSHLLSVSEDTPATPPRINPFTELPFIQNYNRTFPEIGRKILQDYHKVWMTENHLQLRAVWARMKEANETLAWKNFTYPGHYLSRSRVDVLYSQTKGWTENASSHLTEWRMVRAETYQRNILGSVIRVLLKTDMGDIIIQLYDDMPITTANFKSLVQEGVYNDTIFHRVIDGFMIQGGDPTGTGYGDPSIPTIPDEFTDHNRNDRGTIAMANAGPNTGSSQFFINLVDNNYLDSKHPAFGKVIEGMDVVDNIAKVETDGNNRPLQEIKLIKAELID